MKRLKFVESGYRVITYNPRHGWLAYIYDNAESNNNSYFHPIVFIQGLKSRDDALLKIGAEIRYLQLTEINPDMPFKGETTYLKY